MAQYYDQFFVIENATDEDILHEYHKCNMCEAEPIWGIRFKCSLCEDVDLCEPCFDQRLKKLNVKAESSSLMDVGNILCEEHPIECVELPLLADGLAAHN